MWDEYAPMCVVLVILNSNDIGHSNEVQYQSWNGSVEFWYWMSNIVLKEIYDSIFTQIESVSSSQNSRRIKNYSEPF